MLIKGPNSAFAIPHKPRVVLGAIANNLPVNFTLHVSVYLHSSRGAAVQLSSKIWKKKQAHQFFQMAPAQLERAPSEQE
jgi:hypothetical protein